MKSIFYGLTAILIFASCNPDKERRVAPHKPRFRTTDNSELFFRNTRMLYYDTEERLKQKMNLFRFEDRNTDTTAIAVNVMIVHHWRNDMGYIMAEPSPALKKTFEDSISVQWTDTLTTASGKMHFNFLSNTERQYEFAASVYNSILDGHKLEFLMPDGTKRPFFENETYKEAFRITMADFFRFVNVY